MDLCGRRPFVGRPFDAWPLVAATPFSARSFTHGGIPCAFVAMPPSSISHAAFAPRFHDSAHICSLSNYDSGFRLEAVGEVCAAHDCDEAAIEEVFVNMNPVSTLKLGHARAAVMLAPARHGLSVAEYSPNLIKKAVVGAGHADKTQIAFMVKRLLPAAGDVKADAADALAVAITHAQMRKRALLTTLRGAA
jgi:crossover junction endodeoxyribonuclease RuvC